jgi:alpha-mannosidase
LALLNDSKYGHRAKDGILSLNLLRSPLYPDPSADRGEHAFRYALQPHAGDAFEGLTIREATLFNMPPLVMEAGPTGLPRFSVDAENVVLDTIKVAEDGKTLALRLFESHGRACEVALSLPPGWGRVEAADLLERPKGPADPVRLVFGPFEIRTLLVGRS